ncbi:MAG: transporter [Planctomycetaceae bacterium]|nr:transporter [Planctomycetaceae bacterium]
MFHLLGKFVARRWPILIIGWIGLLIFIVSIRPQWASVIDHGEFAFLPADSPSLIGEDVYQESWPQPLASQIVVVVRRLDDDGLTDRDKDFIRDTLQPRLIEIAEKQAKIHAETAEESSDDQPAPQQATVSSFKDGSIGKLLESKDNQASLVVIDLTTEFLDERNKEFLTDVEALTSKSGELHQTGQVPPGLHMAISGSATVGRDLIRAAQESAKATELWTILLVVFLLIVIYRAPALALIPLITVAVSVEISLGVLGLLAQADLVSLFSGIELYVTVLSYGAGVDYCLFLIARYKEELDQSDHYEEAVSSSLGKVGAALTASAGTVMCGIGMLVFAQFGKFHQAGIGITLGLAIVLCAALTLSPALLRLFGRWAFWPQTQGATATAVGGWLSPTNLIGRLLEQDYIQRLWDKVGEALLKRPGTILVGSFAVMTPFAVVAVMYYSDLSYGLLSELPGDNTSVLGAKAVQTHYPAGMASPVTVLLKNEEIDFSRRSGEDFVETLSERMQARFEELHLADIRSITSPLGISHTQKVDFSKMSVAERLRHNATIKAERGRARPYYVGQQGPLKDHITRLDFVLAEDPFSRDSIQRVDSLQVAVAEEIANIEKEAEEEAAVGKNELFVIGSTASIRDLKAVTDADQVNVDILVLLGVFLILVVLLRKPGVSFYLIVSVFFSYLVTLGITIALFYSFDPAGFSGLDWKVPMFLFTILIAVGEDYNIFLMTRIEEEQAVHGNIDGVIVALSRTGSIISSCGVIMAGTFSSLLAGSLVGMHQLGFALAFGVLLDTFVVRPVLVPAFLILVYQGKLGALGTLIDYRFGRSPAVDTTVQQEPVESPSSTATSVLDEEHTGSSESPSSSSLELASE